MQILPLSLRNVEVNTNVQPCIMRVTRVLRRLCNCTVNVSKEKEYVKDASVTLYMIKQRFPLGSMVIMTHLLTHLMGELFLCGLVHSRWMYPMGQHMKMLKDYVRSYGRPKGSIVEGYLVEEILRFCSEYMEGYGAMTQIVRDANEDQAIHNVLVEGKGIR